MPQNTVGTSSEKPIRVLTILLRARWKHQLWGSELSTIELLNGLSQFGVEPYLVDNYPAITRFRQANFPTFEFKSTSRKPLEVLRKAIGVTRVCRAHYCDVIFLATNYWFEGIAVALLASLWTRKPLVLGIPDRFKQEEDTLPLSNLLGAKPGGFALLRRVLFASSRRAVVRRASACLTPTRFVATYLASTMRARRCVVVGRGLDPLWFEYSNNEKHYDAISVGRLSKAKRVDLILLAWQEVILHRPGAKLLLIGAGPYLPKLQSLVRELGIAGGVTFAGYVGDPVEIRTYLQKSKIFVFSSRVEGFARAVSEAMACGVPCLIPDLPELKEVYQDGAIFVPVEDYHALAQEILSLLSDDKRREDISARGRLFAQRFQWHMVARASSRAFARSVGLRTPS